MWKKLFFLSLLWSPTLAASNTTTTTSKDNDNEYDYIIVGSGAGGSPLASRLALSGQKVLLLDAGGDEGTALHQEIPALQLHSVEYAPQKWDYFVNHYDNLTRQEQDSKMIYRTPGGELHKGDNPPGGSEALGILYPRAGTLGGCTGHNAMMYLLPPFSF